MKAIEKRKPRSYKIADKPYNKAKKRANGELATLIEMWVTQYSKGLHISATDLSKVYISMIDEIVK